MRRCRRPWPLLLLATGLILALPAADGGLEIDLPPRVDLAKLTDLVGELVDVTVQYNPQRLQGQTRLALRGRYDAGQLWQLYNQVLAVNGFTTVLAGEPPVYQVVALAEAAGISRMVTPSELAALARPPGYVVLLTELEHLAAEQAVQVLAPLVGGQQGQIKALGKDGRGLVLAGLRDRMLELAALLGTLDQPSVRPVYREFAPENASPQRLQAALTAAWAAAGRVRGAAQPLELQLTPDGARLLLITHAAVVDEVLALARQLDTADPLSTRSYQTGDFAIDEVAALIEQLFPRDRPGNDRLRIVRDQLTDTLMVEATEAQHRRISGLVQELASAPAASRRHMRSFPIRHRKATDMRSLVDELIAGGIDGEAEQPAAAAAPATPAPPSVADDGAAADPPGEAMATTTPAPRPGAVRSSPELQLSVDEATNTLIGVGTSKALERVAQLVAQLDKRQPQVELDVVIVTLTDNDSRELGVRLANMFQRGEASVAIGSLLGAGALSGGIANLAPGGDNAGIAVLEPGDFAGVLTAIETVIDGRRVSRSRLLVDNNAEAALDSVRQVPFSSVNSGDQVATTSFGGTQDAGTQVTVTPTIGAGDHLTLTYSLSESNFEGASGGESASGADLPPPRQTSDLSGVTTIPDGFSVLLGGLTTNLEGETRTRVPILGAIPVLGWFFRTTSRRSEDARTYFLVRASILRHPSFEDLKYLSVRAQTEAGLDDPDWPALQTRFIE